MKRKGWKGDQYKFAIENYRKSFAGRILKDEKAWLLAWAQTNKYFSLSVFGFCGHRQLWYREGGNRSLLSSSSSQYEVTVEDVGKRLHVDCSSLGATGELLARDVKATEAVRSFPKDLPVREFMHIVPEHVDSLSSQQYLSVMSFNVLADMYTYDKRFDYCRGWFLEPSYRRQMVVRDIAMFRPNIFCLQEADERLIAFLEPHMLTLGYTMYSEMKPGLKEGCITAFRLDTLEFDDHFKLNFLDFAQKKLKGRASLSSCEKPNVALILKLRWKAHGTLITVSNTHLSASNNLAQIFQCSSLLEELERFAGCSSAIIMCGDYNTPPDWALYHLVTKGEAIPTGEGVEKLLNDMKISGFKVYHTLPSLGEATPTGEGVGTLLNDMKCLKLKVCHNLPRLRSAYKSLMDANVDDPKVKVQKENFRLDGEPLFTQCSAKQTSTLDYIFYTVETLKCVKLLELPIRTEELDRGRLPSPRWPSDHVSLMAGFMLRQDKESAWMEDPNSRRKTDIASTIHAKPFYPRSTCLSYPPPNAGQVSRATSYQYPVTSSNHPCQQDQESAWMEDPNSRRKTDIASTIHAKPFYPRNTCLSYPPPYAGQLSHANPYQYRVTSSNHPYQQEYTGYSWQGVPPPIQPPVQDIFPPHIPHPQPPNTAGGFPPYIPHPQPPNTAGGFPSHIPHPQPPNTAARGFPPRIHHPQPPDTAGGFPHIHHPQPPNTAGGFPSTGGFPPHIHHPQTPNTAGGFPSTAGGFPPHIHHAQPPDTTGGFPPHIHHPQPPDTYQQE